MQHHSLSNSHLIKEYNKQMKTIYLIIVQITCIGMFTLDAQTINIPNGDFESWENDSGIVGKYERPSGNWTTTDEMNCSPLSASKQTDAQQGTYALKLETSDCQLSGGIHEGFAFGIFRFKQRPSRLNGWYKSERKEGDTAIISAYFHKWNAFLGAQTPIGFAEIRITTSTTGYTSFSLPIRYFLAGEPDTMEIGIFGDVFASRTIGNKLWVDNLYFSTTPVGIADQPHQIDAFRVYPVPASSLVSFDYALAVPAKLKVIIMDITGRTVAEEHTTKPAGNHTTEIDIQKLRNGVYFYTIEADKHSRITGKFSKQ